VTVLLGVFTAGHDDCRRAIVQAGGITCRHHTIGQERRTQLAEGFHRRVGADRFVQTLRHRDGATEVTVERFRDGVLMDRLTLRQADGSDRLTGSLSVPGAPAVDLTAERDGETLVLTRTVAGQTPERFIASASEVRGLEARVLASLGPAAPTALARASDL